MTRLITALGGAPVAYFGPKNVPGGNNIVSLGVNQNVTSVLHETLHDFSVFLECS